MKIKLHMYVRKAELNKAVDNWQTAVIPLVESASIKFIMRLIMMIRYKALEATFPSRRSFVQS